MTRGCLFIVALFSLGYCTIHRESIYDESPTQLNEMTLQKAKKVCSDSLHMYAPNVQDLGSARAIVFLRKPGTPFKSATCLTQFGKIQHISLTLRHQHR